MNLEAPLATRLAAWAEVLEHRPRLLSAARVFRHNLDVALAGCRLPLPGLTAEPWPPVLSSAASVTRFIDGSVVPAERAILANSVAMGARAQRDESPGAISHFGSTVIPPLLAAAEQLDTDSRSTLASMVVGYEVGT